MEGGKRGKRQGPGFEILTFPFCGNCRGAGWGYGITHESFPVVKNNLFIQ
jgi:hypothetical protein